VEQKDGDFKTASFAVLADTSLTNGDSEEEEDENPSTTIAEANSKRSKARIAYTKKHGIAEIVEAMNAGRISIELADRLAHSSKEVQKGELEKELAKPKKPRSVPPPAPPLPENIKTAPPAKPEEKVPAHLLRSIITDDQYAKGFAVFSNVEGKPCSLTPDVCQLEHEERSPYMIGGSNTEKHRKAYAKWEQYDTQKIRRKVLKALEQMSPMDVPPSHKAKGFTYMYNLNKSQDLRELATMLSADLLRQADVLEQQEIYGHLFLT
jgi:hypothetical protein